MKTGRYKYYRWCIHYRLFDALSKIAVNIRPPKHVYPMKWNKKSESFDKFYSWKEILRIAEYF